MNKQHGLFRFVVRHCVTIVIWVMENDLKATKCITAAAKSC